MRILHIILIGVLICSCKPQKVVVTKTEKVHDTIIKVEKIKVNVPVRNFIEVPVDCDSVTNQIKPFKQHISSGPVKVLIESKDGVLTADVNIDSIKQVAISDFQKTIVDTSEIKEITIVKYKTRMWCWWLLLYAVAITLYVFRKPLLKIASTWNPVVRIFQIIRNLFKR